MHKICAKGLGVARLVPPHYCGRAFVAAACLRWQLGKHDKGMSCPCSSAHDQCLSAVDQTHADHACVPTCEDEGSV